MKIRISLGIIGLFSFAATAQNVIRIRPQHQIEHIYTLKEGEHFYRKESNLDFMFDGVNYSFRTTLKGKQYLHENGKSKKELLSNGFSWYYPNRYKNCRVSRKDYLFTVKHHKSGKSYAPFYWGRFFYNENMTPTKSNSNYTTTSNLHAFYYYLHDNSDTTIAIHKRERMYYVVVPGDEPIGPFQDAEIYKASRDELVYSYKLDDSAYLYENGVIHGPYEDVFYIKGDEERPNPRTVNSIFYYQKNGVWFGSHPNLKPYSFSRRPQFSGSNYTVLVIELENKQGAIYSNGEILLNTNEEFHSMNWFLDNMEFNKVEKTFPYQYEVSYKDSLLGAFEKVNTVQLINACMFDKDHFRQGVKRCDTLADGTVKDEEIYFYSPSEGWIGPYQNSKMTRVYFTGETTVAHNYMDSTLQFQDGRFYDQVVAAEFTNANGDWWMLIREEYYDQPYKNGVKYSGNNLPNSFLSYRTPDKTHVLVYKGDEQFVKTKYSNKLIGPVSPRSEIAISKDALNYAEGLRAGNVILINKRAISEGFNLVYNDKSDAFHWINIDEKNRVYLHTYELN
jgi:hypothetical protein